MCEQGRKPRDTPIEQCYRAPFPSSRATLAGARAPFPGSRATLAGYRATYTVSSTTLRDYLKNQTKSAQPPHCRDSAGTMNLFQLRVRSIGIITCPTAYLVIWYYLVPVYTACSIICRNSSKFQYVWRFIEDIDE